MSARQRNNRLARDPGRPPARSATDWRAVEAATSRWDGLRITEDDLDRVAAFFETRRARHLHGELVSFQDMLLEALRSFDWTETDAALLFGIMATTAHLLKTRDNGFPPGFPPGTADRWLVLLLRLVLAAEDGGLESLALARRAMVAELSYHNGAGAEIMRRVRDRLGFDAVAALLNQELTGDAKDPLALAALRHVRQTTEKHLRNSNKPGAAEFLSLSRKERDEILTSVIGEEIALCLGGRRTLADLVDAALEALPPEGPATGWDYVARRTAQRVEREHARDFPQEPARETDRDDVQPVHRKHGDARRTLQTGDEPDGVAALRALVAKIKADPERRAALGAETVKQSRPDAARKAGVSTRTLQNYLADFRRALRRGLAD